MQNDPIESLTDKQAEVLELVLRRMSSKEIARELGISHKSVDKRLDAARIKLGAATRQEAARIYGVARYGESFPGQTLPVTPPVHSVEPPSGAPQGGGGMSGSKLASSSTEEPPALRSVLWPDPKTIGSAGRLSLILAGALALAVLVLVGLGIANGLQSLLET